LLEGGDGLHGAETEDTLLNVIVLQSGEDNPKHSFIKITHISLTALSGALLRKVTVGGDISGPGHECANVLCRGLVYLPHGNQVDSGVECSNGE
jgi:hypothetical protein